MSAAGHHGDRRANGAPSAVLRGRRSGRGGSARGGPTRSSPSTSARGCRSRSRSAGGRGGPLAAPGWSAGSASPHAPHGKDPKIQRRGDRHHRHRYLLEARHSTSPACAERNHATHVVRHALGDELPPWARHERQKPNRHKCVFVLPPCPKVMTGQRPTESDGHSMGSSEATGTCRGSGCMNRPACGPAGKRGMHRRSSRVAAALWRYPLHACQEIACGDGLSRLYKEATATPAWVRAPSARA